jgi:hypothetical protein
VKRQWAAVLAPLLPYRDDGSRVRISYSHPGPDLLETEHVYFDGGDATIEVSSMKAGRLRRLYTVEFNVIVLVQQVGPASVSPDGVTRTPQEVADTRAQEIATVIDEHIADDQHLSSPEVVDQAWSTGTTSSYGYLDNGVVSQVVMRVAFRSRPL